MTLDEYRKEVESIPFGKRLPSAVYVFRGHSSSYGPALDGLLQRVIERCGVNESHNIIKFRVDELKVSFLAYRDFLEDAHPALQHAITIDLARGKHRVMDYTENMNPPILHRKETFLPTDHPRRAEFEALTRAEEEAGLYVDTTTIGFKLNWERLLGAKGLVVNGHKLERRESVPAAGNGLAEIVIDRHKTALTRYELSKPVKSLLEYGLLRTGATFFDYGCGQGADFRGLQGLGNDADGWDPVFRRDAAKREADLVNLGYVLNVIEDPAERLEALVDAYRIAKRVLVVSAMISETVETGRGAQFADGVLTKRNTFQKYFEQQELQQYIEDALETTAIPVALGVFYVFRDPSEQQDFLSARSRRTIDWTTISARLGLGGPPKVLWTALYREHKELLDSFGNVTLQLGRFPEPGEFDRIGDLRQRLGSEKRGLRAFIQGGGAPGLNWTEVAPRFGIGVPARPRWELLYEEHKDLLDAFWNLTLQLGRSPAQDEFARFSELCEWFGSAKRAMGLFMRRGGGEALKRSAENRKNDLLVYVALANLRKRVPFGHLSASLRLDIREFFGNYTRALEKGLELLYAAGDPGEIELACEDLNFGWQDEQALYLHRGLLDELPPVLRAYIGCATALFGDVSQADVIKVHKQSGKATFLVYDDFEGKALPELRYRIKVNLRTRWVQAFDHSQDGQLLYFKERFAGANHPRRAEMEVFSAKLRTLGLSDAEVIELTKVEFSALLKKHGLNDNLNKKRL
ncbi:MAG: DNA phosphorothioation-associated putative methyltransferase [Verrucomicrobiales bacterium]|nr:DNA phosphorothioation-associated putative methyltransferase [Verrucomicrobiales bacterium]